MPPSVGWIVQPALFDTPPGHDPGAWDLARSVLAADEEHIPLALAGGFDTIWVEDHLGWADKSHLECVTTLAWLAGRHAASRWGTMVCSHAFRNPAYLAKLAVNLQLLTGGRFILGLGAGNNGAEHHEFGYPFPGAGRRLDGLEDTIRIARRLWQGGRQTLEGRDHAIHNALVAPRPEPAIPVMVGGGGERRTLRLVADLAEWWCADVGTVDAFRRKSAVLDDHCRTLGRDPGTVTRSQATWVSIADTASDAVRWPNLHIVAGTAEAVAAELIRFRRVGVDHFQLRFMDFPSTVGLTRFVSEVLPRLADAWE